MACIAGLTLQPSAANAQASLPAVEVSGTRTAPNSSLDLEQPNETGSRLGLTPRETPASVSTLQRADIEQRSLTRAQDAAIRLPGITESPSPGNGGTGLVARGFVGHNSVTQLVNGTRLIVASGTITYPFSSWPLESVEVLRGPASVLYGDGAIGAAVNYVTKQPRFDRAEREAFLSVGSFGTVQGGIGLRGPVNDVLAYSIYLDAAKSDGYRTHEDYRRQNYSLALTARPNSALQLTLSLDGGRNDDARYFGTPLVGGTFDRRLRRINFNVDDSIVKFDDRVWQARVDWRLNDSVRLRNVTYHLTTDRHWRNTESYSANTAATQVTRADYLEILHDQSQTGNRFDATFDSAVGAARRNRFVVGLDGYRTELLHTNNSPYGGRSVVDPFDFTPGLFISPVPTLPGRRSTLQTTALFAEDVLDLTPRWKLVGGLRHDRMTFDNDNLRTSVSLSRTYSPTTGRIGTIWAASDVLSLYAQYGTATDPLSGALSLPGGGNTFDLTRGQQAEVGAKGSLPAIKGEWTVATYRIEKSNLLSRDVVDPTTTQQVGRQSSTGIELALAAEPLPGWTIDTNAAFLRARYEDFNEIVAGRAVSRSGNVPVNVPQRSGNVWTTYRFQPQWLASLGARYVGARPSNAANTASLPAYTVFDASLAYAYSNHLSLTLAVKNLADRDYALSGIGNAFWLLGAPRTVQLIARARF